MFNCAAHPFYLKNDDNVDDNDGSDVDAVVTKTGSVDDESKKGNDKSESETAEEESVSRLWYKSRDLAELAGHGGEELLQTSFNNAHNKP